MPDPTPVRPCPAPSQQRIEIGRFDSKPLDEYVSAMETLATLRREKLDPEGEKFARSLERRFRNCCGQYALTCVCREAGREVQLTDVIQQSNPLGIFTGPLEMLRFLKKEQIPATEHNRGTAESLTEHLRSGGSAILMVNADLSRKSLCPHWVVINGVRRDENGEIRWAISDAANMAGSENGVGEISHDDLMLAWSKPLGGFSPYRNYWIAVGESREGLRLPGAITLPNRSADLLNQLARATAAGGRVPGRIFQVLNRQRHSAVPQTAESE
jgi:hypothetical protein